jgi:transglutaminase-like putative cysteine protease
VRFIFSRPFFQIAVCCALFLTFNQLTLAKDFSLKPVPSWVQKIVPAVDPGSSSAEAGTSSTRILDDEQTRVGASVERFFHYYQRVDNTTGLEDLSQLRFYFEPSYQQLSIHFVRILRNGATIDALNPSEIKTIQEEDDLDQQLYNGTSAAVIFVNDVRVGDVIEYAYTVTGDNPVLGGRFADTFYLADKDPIRERFLRLLIPSKRTLAIKAENTDIQPTTKTIGDDTEYLWLAKNIDAVSGEDSTPNWFNPYPRINVSEFQTWADVVNWALPFYENSPIKNAELRAKIEEWKNASSQPEQRTIAALRFVQDEIRYLGIELGRYSHQPTVPEKVFTRRFGDCKDKSLLLSSILTSMGIEAWPALVNSTLRSEIDSWQPTPFAFDHVIVQAKINGKTYWLDPTISYQRGTLANYYDPPFERSLVLHSGTTALEKIPSPISGAGSVDIVESYTGASSRSPVSLIVTKIYRGMEADAMRYSLSSVSPADLGKTHLNYYAATTPSISADGLPVIEDDQQSNTIVVKEKYRIAELWKDNRHSFIADRIYNELQKPHVSQRNSPLEVHYPLSIKQTILINLGSGFDFPESSDVLADDAMRFEYSYSKSGNQMNMEFVLKTFADSVPVPKLQRHLEILDEAQNVIGYDLNRSRMAVVSRGSSKLSSGATLFIVLLLMFVPLVAIGVGVWVVRTRDQQKRRTRFVKDQQARPGTSPETAYRMSSAEQIEAYIQSLQCRCGTPLYDYEHPPKRERFNYDGQRLLGVRLQCPACRETLDLYMNPLFENERAAGIADFSAS